MTTLLESPGSRRDERKRKRAERGLVVELVGLERTRSEAASGHPLARLAMRTGPDQDFCENQPTDGLS